MAEDEHGGELRTANSSDRSVDSGTALVSNDAYEDPGMPEHGHRVTDSDPKKEKNAARVITLLFWVSLACTLFAMFAYFIWPIDREDITSVRLHSFLLGAGIALGMLSLGVGAVAWAKYLMKDEELSEARHKTGASPATAQRVTEIFAKANDESGFSRRKLLRNSLITAVLALPLPGIVLFRDLYNGNNEHPVDLLHETMWDKGVRLVRDPSGTPIKASDVTIGSAFHVIPETLTEMHHGEEMLNAKAKAIVLLMRLPEDRLNEKPERKDWSYHGIVAYSKVCTHVGCPVALYEQQTHHLLCPCHQSQFDVTNHCEVIFGPAGRPLPQLPIEVDGEGYLVAQSDFHEPVGPTFWERRHDYNV
ncbi:ubiquinol-cytochrome c reductase iron-sulfur subunit [Gulosibacter sp. 10]|uniref:cytochrome bc1 complex Rieske iron-sulfur subunit n=1 Tax=Gulosibacter sp. 10 TaxID=1255570 RepID=UPI00097EBFFD|nr:Rieske 2Fe-2S domain-containing protein [Gulosibacter sp. 10]SJM65682.1 Ubiquinol-cytochrome C reductase iron-sulfur subunit [Gulosibacter sp. 10]